MHGKAHRLRLVLRPLAPGEFDAEAAFLAGSVGLGAGALAWHATGTFWPHCWFRELTGLPCPFCGATQAGLALLHGHVLCAAGTNPLASFVYVLVGLYDLYAISRLGLGPRRLCLRLRLDGFDQPRQKILLLTMLCLLIGTNWVYLIARFGHFGG